MIKKFIKISFFLSLFALYQACGYEPLLTEKYQKFSVNNFNIDGNKKLGQALANRFTKVDDSKNNLTFNIKASKKREISNKSSTGAALEYSVNVNFELQVISVPNGKEIFNQNFHQSGSFKASDLHLNTLNREKNIVDNMIKNIAEQITNKLNLVYN